MGEVWGPWEEREILGVGVMGGRVWGHLPHELWGRGETTWPGAGMEAEASTRPSQISSREMGQNMKAAVFSPRPHAESPGRRSHRHSSGSSHSPSLSSHYSNSRSPSR